MQKAITQTWFFRQTPQDVWEYLTKPELIAQWLMKTDFKPIKGHHFTFTHDPGKDSKYDGVVHCEVLEVKPYNKLSYSWNGSTKGGKRKFNSIVVWSLVQKDNGTELRLQHDGFTVLDDILAHTSGWDQHVKQMTELLNKIQ